jgi:hypothetical protein
MLPQSKNAMLPQSQLNLLICSQETKPVHVVRDEEEELVEAGRGGHLRGLAPELVRRDGRGPGRHDR